MKTRRIRKVGFYYTLIPPDWPHEAQPVTPERGEAWIRAFETINPSVWLVGRCQDASALMTAYFPDLKVVQGWVSVRTYFHRDMPRWNHWWCEDGKGNRYDPSRSQFIRIDGYGYWSEQEPEPCGWCPSCGTFLQDLGCPSCEPAQVEEAAASLDALLLLLRS